MFFQEGLHRSLVYNHRLSDLDGVLCPTEFAESYTLVSSIHIVAEVVGCLDAVK